MSPRTPYQTWVHGMERMKAGETFPTGTCLKQQRLNWDVDSYDFTPGNGRDPWAIEAFDFAQFKHKSSEHRYFPDYVSIFWRSNRPGRPGHIAQIGKHGSGICLTTDPTGHPGNFGLMKIDDISRAWGMTLVGWVEDLNKVRIWTPPASKPAAPPKPKVATPSIADEFKTIDRHAIRIINNTTRGTPNNHAAWQVHNVAKDRRSA